LTFTRGWPGAGTSHSDVEEGGASKSEFQNLCMG